MREIKFRQAIFHSVTGDFVHWHYWGLIDGAFIGVDTGWYSPVKAIENSQQYTGKKGKNGKEVYGGDILSCNPDEYWTVIWVDKEACFALKDGELVVGGGLEDANEYLEVVGNIYENKELLNERD